MPTSSARVVEIDQRVAGLGPNEIAHPLRGAVQKLRRARLIARRRRRERAYSGPGAAILADRNRRSCASCRSHFRSSASGATAGEDPGHVAEGVGVVRQRADGLALCASAAATEGRAIDIGLEKCAIEDACRRKRCRRGRSRGSCRIGFLTSGDISSSSATLTGMPAISIAATARA